MRELSRELLLEVKNLRVQFNLRKGLWRKKEEIYAVDGVSFRMGVGESLGIVGESGSGKSSLAKGILRLLKGVGGSVWFDGVDWLGIKRKEYRELCWGMQAIFQDPFGSLNPRMRVEEIIGEGLSVHNLAGKDERECLVRRMLEEVGLDGSYGGRYPHEFSGGQRQRIGIARALIMRPKLMICDEPVSALDVSIQAQILNLMKRLQKEYRLAYLMISHDLAVVDYFCDRILIMYLGKVMEYGLKEDIILRSRHPYTVGLLSSIPDIRGGGRIKRVGRSFKDEDMGMGMGGCIFRGRCDFRVEECEEKEPELREVGAGHYCACHKA